jgi:hypothetical protein
LRVRWRFGTASVLLRCIGVGVGIGFGVRVVVGKHWQEAGGAKQEAGGAKREWLK